MDLEPYKKKFPYICNICGKFAHTLSKDEYCEKCGTFSSLREAKDSDYKKYIKIYKKYIMEQNKYKHKTSISEEKVKKSLVYSIITIVVTPFLALIGLIFSYITTTGIYIFSFSIMLMSMGIVSLIFYFINPEISYGMWVSRKKAKNFNSRYIKIGQRISMGILIAGLCVITFVFIVTINAITSSS